MMKQVKFTMPLRMLAILCGLFLSVSAFAQQITVNGHVKDATGEPIIGATVRTAGQDGGVVSISTVISPLQPTKVPLCRYPTSVISRLKSRQLPMLW